MPESATKIQAQFLLQLKIINLPSKMYHNSCLVFNQKGQQQVNDIGLHGLQNWT